MAKIQFDVKYRDKIESGEYKVETRDGKKVRALCYDANNTMPVFALVTFDNGTEGPLGYYSNGTMISDGECPLDLFIVTPEPELSEFEKACMKLYNEGRDDGLSGDKLSNESVKEWASELLALAKNQLQKEGLVTMEHLNTACEAEYQSGLADGKAAALQAYPPTYTTVKRHAKRVQSERTDTHQPARAIFQQGYEQTENDLALTPEDVVVLVNLYEYGKANGWTAEDVIRRFNEQRKK